MDDILKEFKFIYLDVRFLLLFFIVCVCLYVKFYLMYWFVVFKKVVENEMFFIVVEGINEVFIDDSVFLVEIWIGERVFIFLDLGEF